ncbi:unnamed protein product [Protopolystoma xenopodis]|uniref:Uncharacterized protein n=1 Tax=Protopolystoma xenopodis TaxID=117903 RepID=A0A3S5B1W0_9PLAT|nr:unnamed protein product [Protopolystoma xenopodis]
MAKIQRLKCCLRQVLSRKFDAPDPISAAVVDAELLAKSRTFASRLSRAKVPLLSGVEETATAIVMLICGTVEAAWLRQTRPGREGG